MATYDPPAFPRRPKESSLLTEGRYHLELAYYRWKIITAQYVMSPGEKLVYNLIVLGLLAMLFTSVYYYLPGTVQLASRRLGYYVMGCNHKIETGTAQMLEAVREGPASLQHLDTTVNRVGSVGLSCLESMTLRIADGIRG